MPVCESSYAAMLLMVGFLLVSTQVVPISTQVSPRGRASLDKFSGGEQDLVSLLTVRKVKNEHIRDARSVIETIQGSSTCFQMAAFQLLTSCQSLESGFGEDSSSALVERVKNLYAARLAICELEGAQASIPSQCAEIMSITLADIKDEELPLLTRIWYGRESLEAKILKPCVKALREEGPSHWTSYSNNRIQAVTMCHAMRDSIDRDHTLEVHSRLLKVVSKATDATSDVVQELKVVYEQSTADAREFRILVGDFMTTLQPKLGEVLETVQSSLDLLTRLPKSVDLAAEAARHLVVAVEQGLHNISKEFLTVEEGAVNILRPLLEGGAQLSANIEQIDEKMVSVNAEVDGITGTLHSLQDFMTWIDNKKKLADNYNCIFWSFIYFLRKVVCALIIAPLLEWCCAISFCKALYICILLIAISYIPIIQMANFAGHAMHQMTELTGHAEGRLSKTTTCAIEAARSNYDLLLILVSGVFAVYMLVHTVCKWDVERRAPDKTKPREISPAEDEEDPRIQQCRRFSRAQTAPAELCSERFRRVASKPHNTSTSLRKTDHIRDWG